MRLYETFLNEIQNKKSMKPLIEYEKNIQYFIDDILEFYIKTHKELELNEKLENYIIPSFFEDYFMLDFDLISQSIWKDSKGNKINKKHIRLFIKYILLNEIQKYLNDLTNKYMNMKESDKMYDFTRLRINYLTILIEKCCTGVLYNNIIKFIC